MEWNPQDFRRPSVTFKMRGDGGGKRGPGGQGQLGGGDCKDFGGSGGGVTPAQSASVEENNPCEETAFQQASPCKLSTLQNFSKTANFSSPQSLQKPQSFGHRKVFKNRKVSATAKSSKTANFSFLCGVPQTFHFSAEYRKLFSRRQAGLGPPGSSLWPVARAGSE